MGQISLSEEDLARSRRLNRLIEPPLVVVVGAANVGKSTLGNALVGRSMSIATDLPGSTRDYTSGRVELAGVGGALHQHQPDPYGESYSPTLVAF